MTRDELIKMLKTFDRDAEIVIGGAYVTGVEQVVGRRSKPLLGEDRFYKTDKGHDKAIVFTKLDEMSDGLYYPSIV
jgi:hypothetical protein